MQFEMAMGPSHECHDCGSTFLANSDRCSHCGSYRIKPLHLLEVEREEWNMETYPIMYWDREIGFHHISIGDFSPWPRV